MVFTGSCEQPARGQIECSFGLVCPDTPGLKKAKRCAMMQTKTPEPRQAIPDCAYLRELCVGRKTLVAAPNTSGAAAGAGSGGLWFLGFCRDQSVPIALVAFDQGRQTLLFLFDLAGGLHLTLGQGCATQCCGKIG